MAQRHCGRTIWRNGADRHCHQTVGLTRWTDAIGLEHAACHAHLAVMQSLWPPHLEMVVPRSIDREAFGLPPLTEAEKRAAWGDR